MHNEQKMRVVEMFDLAKNVREVKLTYANIAESLNFGESSKKKVTNVASSQAQSITEGLASKPVAGTKPSAQIISESKVPSQVSRFQKLAGISKKA
jgi:predicted regulator of amino acid metabolism with ACT domain